MKAVTDRKALLLNFFADYSSTGSPDITFTANMGILVSLAQNLPRGETSRVDIFLRLQDDTTCVFAKDSSEEDTPDVSEEDTPDVSKEDTPDVSEEDTREASDEENPDISDEYSSDKSEKERKATMYFALDKSLTSPSLSNFAGSSSGLVGLPVVSDLAFRSADRFPTSPSLLNFAGSSSGLAGL